MDSRSHKDGQTLDGCVWKWVMRPKWSCYPLVNSHIAIENGHRNSEFSHWKWCFIGLFGKSWFTRGSVGICARAPYVLTHLHEETWTPAMGETPIELGTGNSGRKNMICLLNPHWCCFFTFFYFFFEWGSPIAWLNPPFGTSKFYSSWNLPVVCCWNPPIRLEIPRFFWRFFVATCQVLAAGCASSGSSSRRWVMRISPRWVMAKIVINSNQ